MRYAEQTTVTAGRSREEIERTLARYGAEGFYYGWESTYAILGFTANGRRVQFELPMPDKEDHAYTHSSRGRRTTDVSERLWEQATRQRWRALSLVVKAKLEAISSGITTFDEEFLAHFVVRDGDRLTTFGRLAIPELERLTVSGSAFKELGA